MRLDPRSLVVLPFLLALVPIACGDEGTPPDPNIPLPERDGGDEVVTADSGTDAIPDVAPDVPPSCALSSGLVGWWTFEEGTETTTADKSPSKNDGTLVGPTTWSTEKPPTQEANTNSLAFDGVQAHVEIGNPDILKITGSLTLTAWIKTAGPIGNYRTLVSKWWSGGEDAAWSLHWSEPGGLGFSVNSATNQEARAASMQNLNDNAWHHVAGTWDGLTVRIYTDGKERGTLPTANFGPLADIAHPVRIATDNRYPPGGGDRYFGGNIDDVRIYTRALIAEEIGMLFNGSCAKVP